MTPIRPYPEDACLPSDWVRRLKRLAITGISTMNRDLANGRQDWHGSAFCVIDQVNTTLREQVLARINRGNSFFYHVKQFIIVPKQYTPDYFQIAFHLVTKPPEISSL